MPNTSYYIQSSSHIVTPLKTKKNGVIIKILHDVTKGKVFLISLLITWTNVNVFIRGNAYTGGDYMKGRLYGIALILINIYFQQKSLEAMAKNQLIGL